MRTEDTSARLPLYQELYRKLRRKIETGEYPVGSRLPSEAEISQENGVSRITSKHALEQLVSEGFIKRFPGKGTFVVSGTGRDDMHRQTAQGKAGGRLIGVLMEEISHDYGSEILMGIEKQCAEAGYSAIVKFSYGDEAREVACIEEMIEAGVTGIVLMCVYSEVYSSSVMKLALEGFPLVFVDRCLKGLPVPYVGTNHLLAARQMTDELVRRGHTHLAIAMFDESHTTSSVEERMAGYADSCLAHDLLCGNKRLLLSREGVFHSSAEIRAENREKIRAFLRENPETTAILAVSAHIAIILLDAAADNAIQCVASFDGPLNSFQTPCELICVLQDQFGMGRTACARLIARMNQHEVPAVTHVPHRMPESEAADV